LNAEKLDSSIILDLSFDFLLLESGTSKSNSGMNLHPSILEGLKWFDLTENPVCFGDDGVFYFFCESLTSDKAVKIATRAQRYKGKS
jgi:hypothetical protein